MSRCAARALPLATAVALLLCSACNAVSVDLGSDIPHHKPSTTGSSGDDPGSSSASDDTGGSASTASGSGGTPGAAVMPHDAGTPPRLDADVAADADAAADAATEDAGIPPRCPAGFEDCDGEPGNGCETDLHTEVMHCGSCARACPAFGLMSFGSTCVDGACVLTCEAPFENCDGDPDNGCETAGRCR